MAWIAEASLPVHMHVEKVNNYKLQSTIKIYNIFRANLFSLTSGALPIWQSLASTTLTLLPPPRPPPDRLRLRRGPRTGSRGLRGRQNQNGKRKARERPRSGEPRQGGTLSQRSNQNRKKKKGKSMTRKMPILANLVPCLAVSAADSVGPDLQISWSILAIKRSAFQMKTLDLINLQSQSPVNTKNLTPNL